MSLFAAQAQRCCAFATALMGWRADEAWAATPGEFWAAHMAFLQWHGVTTAPAPGTAALLQTLTEEFPDD